MAAIKEFLKQSAVMVQFGCFIHLVHEHVVDITMCLGPSMLPTFNAEGDIVVVEHVSTKLNKLKWGDVVVATSPTNPNMVVCKRILGMPGEPVRKDKHAYGYSEIVPPGHVWLQGDNPRNSNDSRHYGPVPLGLVRGKVVFKVWPATEMGGVRSGPPPDEPWLPYQGSR